MNETIQLEVNGRLIEVDKSFNDLSPEDKQRTINEIAFSFTPTKEELAAQEKESSDVLDTTGIAAVLGAVGGMGEVAAGRPIENVLGRKLGATAIQNPATGEPAGWKWTRKTGFGAGLDPTVEGQSSEFKRREAEGKFQDKPGKREKIPGKALTLDQYLQNKARDEAEAKAKALAAKQAEREFSFRKPTSFGGKTLGLGGRMLAGAGTLGMGAEAVEKGTEAYDKFKSGDIKGAARAGRGALLNTLGSLGSAATFVPHPLFKGIGAAVGTAAPIVNMMLEEAGYKQGGLANKYAGGGVAKGGLSLAKKFGYDPKKVAKNYPELMPGVPTLDPKTGKEFTKKVLSQEAEAVQKARKAAQAEIDKGQYTPFFDVTQRSYVNPADYPLVGRTLTDVLPKKAETIEKYRMLAESPEATARLKAAFAEGSKAPAAKDWYAMKQLEDAFVQELGPEAGKLAFRQRFAEPMAATTGGADPTSNLMMTAYTNFMREKGLPIPSAAHELPFPIGGRYVSGNMEQARRYHQQGSIPIDNPKRHNFASNFMGYRDRPTIDEQMMGLFAPGKGAPEAGTYGVYESALNKLAKEAGVEPVNFQDVAWAGAKKYQGKPMMQEINEMIYRTSRVTGETPEEVLKGYIRGNKPMYGLTGLGALAAQEDGGVNNPE